MDDITIQQATQKITNIIKFEQEVDRLLKELRKARKELGAEGQYWMNHPDQISLALTNMFGEGSISGNSSKLKVFENCFENNLELSICYLLDHFYNDPSVDKLREAAFKCVLANPNYIYDNFIKKINHGKNAFDDDQTGRLYYKYGKTFFNKVSSSLIPFYNYCKLFDYFVSHDEMELFIKRIVGRKSYIIAGEILNRQTIKNVDAHLKEQLESLLVAQKLM